MLDKSKIICCPTLQVMERQPKAKNVQTREARGRLRVMHLVLGVLHTSNTEGSYLAQGLVGSVGL